MSSQAATAAPATPRDRLLEAAAVVGGLYVAAYLAATLVIDPAGRAGLLLGDGVFLVAPLVAAPLMGLAAWRMRGPYRRFWAVMALSSSLWVAGDALWVADVVLLHRVPSPSLPDVFLIGSLLLIPVAALAGFGSPLRHWRELLDMSIVLGAIGYAGYVFLQKPYLSQGLSGAAMAAVVESGLDTIAALVVLGAAVPVYRLLPLSMKLLVAGILTHAAGYAVYSHLVATGAYQEGSWVLTGWQLAAVLSILASLVALRRDEPAAVPRADPNRELSTWTVIGGLILVLAVIAVRSDGLRLDREAVFVGLAAITAVVLRLRVAVRDRELLAERLEQALKEQRRLAITDPLTGLPNRRVFDRRLEEAAAEALDGGPPIGVLIIDVDHFKAVNDGFGHPVGDHALRQVAARLTAVLRAGDTIVRMGGEEFAVLAGGVTQSSLTDLAERCRRAVACDPIEINGFSIPLTTSIGGACLPSHSTHPDGVVHAADRALYEAKKTGRNRSHVGAAGSPRRVLPMPESGALAYLTALADRLDGEQSRHEHSMAMIGVAARLCEVLGLGSDQRRRCLAAARLHDVGKVGVPRHILTKAGPLTDAERDIMRDHVRIGVELLRSCAETRDIAPIVGEHHERMDGGGYPIGKTGPEISVEARILQVADAWTAMLADRPYRAALSPEQAHRELVEGAGYQFDERVVAAMLQLLDDGAFDLRPQDTDRAA